MTDSASGSIAGFLFQFEKALVLLATLDNTKDVVSIEQVDDVAIQSEDDLVLVAIQSKHSISPSGTTFGDTSRSLWRTLEIWIQKIELGVFDNTTKFICSTNKKIAEESLLSKIKTNNFDKVLEEVNLLLTDQKEKLEKLKTTKKATSKDPGSSIKQTIKRIEFVLSKQDVFRIVKENLVIEDQEVLKERFLIAIHMSTDNYNRTKKDLVFEAMYGWIVAASKAKWMQGTKIPASFSKKEFDSKLSIVTSNSAIVNAVFRKKSDLGTIDERRLTHLKKELFVKQITDIERNERSKQRIIEKAVSDFIYHEIEMAHIVKGGDFTEPDFLEFQEVCKHKWQSHYDAVVRKELDEYNDIEKNDMAIDIFDKIMNDIVVHFQDGIAFNSSNSYIHNGTFLKLSNVPEIGWHPDWESKYKK